ncbi:chemotaxis protein histidine kinase CheA [Microbacterium endophyticum]|uniref:Chemotaxis protein histidine kinase CheA n=1 Tax=Microbacterium endophyticum TaxID=1526412 RepID=A0A7W4V455_9MICO|nr:hypothetical protein [Microbacterium endophyticum]MBB2976174.1 chemotaxis protein histidine kinase CheA [Microbacterium endophyticum]NIK36471.1 chemotaxis protein histidine kinase CheA [Microbacterium endophyticum]
MLHSPELSPARRAKNVGIAIATASVIVATGIFTASPALASTSDSAPAVTPTTSRTSDTLEDMTTKAESALVAARSAVAESVAATVDANESGLDLGNEPTAIETADLLDTIDEMSNLEIVPALLLPDDTADAIAETKRVRAETAKLTDRVEAAEAERAAKEAAEKAAAEKAAAEKAAAEAAAAEAAAEAQKAQEAAPATAPAAPANPSGAQATAQQLAASNYGWGDDQFACLVSLWNKESGWNAQASNGSSGAYGIPQALPGSKMASAGADWATNATTQIVWGLQYIAGSYGTPCGAWSHSQSTGWY